MRRELKAELEERDYAKVPLSAAELREIFAKHDPRDFLNPKSPNFKAMGLTGRKLSAEEALKLIAEDARIIKRPLVAVGGRLIAGFDKDALRKAFA